MHWVSGKHVTCCDFAKVFHLYIIQFLKYRQTQVSSVCQVFVSLSHSLLALLCVASICFKRACLIICCIAIPPTHPYKMTGLLPERLQYGLVCCCLPSLRKIATIYSEIIPLHVMSLQNDRSLSKPYKMGCCSYFLASHASKGLASRLRRIYLRAFIHFLCPHHAPTKWEVPVETAIIWFGVLLFPAHIVIKPKTPQEKY